MFDQSTKNLRFNQNIFFFFCLFWLIAISIKDKNMSQGEYVITFYIFVKYGTNPKVLRNIVHKYNDTRWKLSMWVCT